VGVVAKKAALLVLAGVLGYLAAAGVPSGGSAAPAWFSMRAKVTRVVDGDTLHARVGRKIERVRLIGIDAPESGDCFAPSATLALRRLALNKTVRVTGDRTQTRRDVHGRLLAYVTLPNGVDVGRHLLARGYATLYETSRPFARVRGYTAAAAGAERANAGLHAICATVGSPPPRVAPPIVTGTNPSPNP
jgi:micrococcal nuclease